MTTEFESLVGKTISEISVATDKETVEIALTNGDTYKMYHSQDCCESVAVDDVVGDLNDLVGSPVVRAEERSQADTPPGAEPSDDGNTWTFYELATNRGSVTIRWHGSSNGYYSESVDFVKIKEGTHG